MPRLINSYSLIQLGFSTEDERRLLELARIHSHNIWKNSINSQLNDSDINLIRSFKSCVKDHLFHVAQGACCCFCGIELANNKGSFDLDHLISKNNRINLIFNVNNLALICKVCNGFKSDKKVTANFIDEADDICYLNSSDYIIVNPHIDEWAAFLSIDQYGRVWSNQPKGNATLNICGIHSKNAIALAEYFSVFRLDVKERKDWINFYVILSTHDDDSKKTKYKNFMKKLLELKSDPAGEALLSILEPLLN